jgi:hypothetical protein
MKQETTRWEATTLPDFTSGNPAAVLPTDHPEWQAFLAILEN